MPQSQRVSVGGREINVTNLDKLYFPEAGVTKGDVLAYYMEVADVLLPHLRNRPLTLKRYPEGVAGEHFYEKDAPPHTPAWISRFSVPRRVRKGKDTSIEYLLINDVASLAWTVEMSNIEMHVFLAEAPQLDRPTAVVFDLDPGAPADIVAACRTAMLIRHVLERFDLQSFVKVSGSKGLQVYLPLNTPTSYETTGPFARSLAHYLAKQHPELVVAAMDKQIRRGKVFIDWSQNRDFKTTVAAYSLRAKSDAPHVSVPVAWREIENASKRERGESLYFSPAQALRRIAKHGDLFQPVLSMKQALPVELEFSQLAQRGSRARASEGKGLTAYEAKRDFSRTSEPAPGRGRAQGGSHRYVIQKHQASHLHYDFRLEMEGVLRSWAVPKGLPMKAGERRLALHVEDHPLEYGEFEGTIPEGNYGAGTVMLWDRGGYEVENDQPAAGFYKGKLHLRLSGEKLKGQWILVQTGGENKWLIMRPGTEASRIAKSGEDRSVTTGRTMEEISEEKTAEWSNADIKKGPAKSRKRGVIVPRRVADNLAPAAPRFVAPMLPLAVTDVPAGPEWLYEAKLDGFRALLIKDGDKASLLSRNGKPLSKFKNILREALDLPCRAAAVDGELVLLDKDGRPSFQGLQGYHPEKDESRLFFYVFDLLNVDGKSLMNLPLESRKEYLHALLWGRTQLRFSETLDAPPEILSKTLKDLGIEGIVAKKRDSLYEPGRRSGAWVKYKLSAEQEFVVGGYTRGAPFDAMLAGYYEGKDLIFAGRVKGGFNKRLREALSKEMKPLVRTKCPFANLPLKTPGRWGEGLGEEDMAKCVWLKPELVAQIAFREWTHAGLLRHPSFVALREDKEAKDVVREGVVPSPRLGVTRSSGGGKGKRRKGS